MMTWVPAGSGIRVSVDGSSRSSRRIITESGLSVRLKNPRTIQPVPSGLSRLLSSRCRL